MLDRSNDGALKSSSQCGLVIGVQLQVELSQSQPAVHAIRWQCLQNCQVLMVRRQNWNRHVGFPWISIVHIPRFVFLCQYVLYAFSDQMLPQTSITPNVTLARPRRGISLRRPFTCISTLVAFPNFVKVSEDTSITPSNPVETASHPLETIKTV